MNEHNSTPKTIGRYRIDEMVGQGCMGVVYKGYDPYIKRQVAIKVTHQDESFTESQVQRYREHFFTEAQSAGGLIHGNIVTIYDVGLEGDSCYIAMEFFDGKDLSAYCTKGKLLPLDKVITLTGKICEALDFAHQRGVIHRDIKPANIMISRDAVVKITDFGVAQVGVTEAAHSDGITGSLEYMAPEVIQEGRASKESDIYSLGLTLYELLTGEQPFRREFMSEVVNTVINHRPPPIYELNPEIPENVSAVIMNAMEKKPEGRFRESMEFLYFLKGAMKQACIPEHEETDDERIRYMRALKFFKKFNDRDLQEVLKIGTWYRYGEGKVIVRENETDRNFYIVILGQVHVQQGKEAIAMIDRGSCFGEMAALTNQRRTATIVASRDCVVLRIEADALNHLSKDLQILFYNQFLNTLINRLESTDERLRHVR